MFCAASLLETKRNWMKVVCSQLLCLCLLNSQHYAEDRDQETQSVSGSARGGRSQG